jgi:cytochrome b
MELSRPALLVVGEASIEENSNLQVTVAADEGEQLNVVLSELQYSLVVLVVGHVEGPVAIVERRKREIFEVVSVISAVQIVDVARADLRTADGYECED